MVRLACSPIPRSGGDDVNGSRKCPNANVGRLHLCVGKGNSSRGTRD